MQRKYQPLSHGIVTSLSPITVTSVLASLHGYDIILDGNIISVVRAIRPWGHVTVFVSGVLTPSDGIGVGVAC